MLKQIVSSFLFRRLFLVTIIYIFIIFIANKVFDTIWHGKSELPLLSVDEIYRPPAGYNNITKIRIRLLNLDTVFIEGNNKFRLNNSNKNYNYYDTFRIQFPEQGNSYINKIYLRFEGSNYNDSVFIVVSKSDKKEMYWKQIFYSSVEISDLNKSNNDSVNYRNIGQNFVSKDILENNDTLINQAYRYFNSCKDTIYLPECGVNSEKFKSVCDKFSLPCRIIGLMGGDANDPGFNTYIGYPSHALCEIYSSREKKWYVVDPTYGSTYRLNNTHLSAVEISNEEFFLNDKNITQDSVLFTKSYSVNTIYYKYYENVYFKNEDKPNYFIRTILKYFYKNFNYRAYNYSNYYLFTKNAYYYIGFKSLTYFLITFINIQIVFFIILLRLYKTKFKK